MKQVSQRLRDGRIDVRDVPPPVTDAGDVLIDVRASLLSSGTERSRTQAARSSLIGKAKARPEQARQVLDKARQEGLRSTLEAVRSKLDAPTPLGYSSAGVVLEVGDRVPELRPGDRVACAGGGYAVHAELNRVPANLCVRLPDGVSFDSGAFATVGSIALHGVRQAEAKIGERVAVIGLGLVGQLACRLLRAAGCEVVGVDPVAELVSRATASGVRHAYVRADIDPSSPPADIEDCDAVVITAATPSEDPIRLAGVLARDRARVVIVGDVGLTFDRASYYGKELELRLSRSYGPGRYDRAYEERGLDYPIGYVRWTERRNLSAFVAMLADGRLSVEDLITARIPVDDAAQAYDQLLNAESSPLGQILTYEPSSLPRSLGESLPGRAPARLPSATSPVAGLIGAGSFAQRVLIPGLRETGFQLGAIASATGLSTDGASERFGFQRTATPDELLASDDLDVICIASRHGSHAAYATRALERGLAVFVEKPPALSLDQLDQLRDAAQGRVLRVGFNRRHAPLALAMREHVVRPEQPVELVYRVAAGRLKDDHWLNDPDDGGGRFIGEGCHFMDFACWFTSELPVSVNLAAPSRGQPLAIAQRFVVNLEFPSGSIATILYGSESARGIGKEYVEAHSAGRSALLYDFTRLELLGSGRRRVVRDRRQNKGHTEQLRAFRADLRGAAPEGPDALDTMRVTLNALSALRLTD